MLPDRDIGVLLNALAYRELDQRPRHGFCDQAEIARWKGIVAGSLEAKVEADTQRHRSGSCEVLFKAGKELAERALTAGEECVRMPRLRRPSSMGCIERENVALHHHDMFEEVGKDARRRQAGHSRTNNDGLPAIKVDAI
jgi:hypothetical protein